MGSRRKGRVVAFQALYSWKVNNNDIHDLLGFDWLEEEQRGREDMLAFASLLIKGVVDHVQEVDESIKAHLKRWDFSRIVPTDLALLRLGTYSLLYQKDTPASVVINEIVTLSRRYSGSESYRFINGILDAISKDRG